ncbi:helix-turn-helix transcriptional regulator [Caulobacter sp. BE254]|uniref:helix-turn-helix domain-containing protein n=1 Tax=Caulobacter sp. BE254 TaxID=2817720 RepID=UPI00285B7E95|nr:helix-turn-helix transcriptional regulator [Caulobacter sp. BE254]MDR7117359.1 transcriptional regulator with XRE-family HTH domain [Caulobacter sp. BE254]
MATLQEQVGALIRHHRVRLGLSQQEVADRIGRTNVQLSRIENGKSAPEFDSLSLVADALGVEVRDLFELGDYAARDGRQDPLVDIIGLLSPLSEDELSRVKELLTAAFNLRS